MAQDGIEANDIKAALKLMRSGGEITDVWQGWKNPRTPKHLFVGKRMDDDTIFAGMSPVTGRPMFTTIHDSGLAETFGDAAAFAAALNPRGRRNGWRIPEFSELMVMFSQRARIGGFLLNPGNKLGEYWTSTPFYRRGQLEGMFEAGLDRNEPATFPQKPALRLVRG